MTAEFIPGAVDLDPVATPTLTPEELAFFEGLGRRRRVSEGEYLYRDGDTTYDFYAIVSGSVEIVAGPDERNVVAHHGAGRFLGELNLLTGMRVFVSARVTQAGEVIEVPRNRLREVIAKAPGLGDKLLAAFLARRSALMTGAASSVRVVGYKWCSDSLRIREFLTRCRVPHEWLDVDNDPDVDALVQGLGVVPADLPVVIAATTVLRHPTLGELSTFLGLTVQSAPGTCYDLVIVGGGPSGLAAAVYGASEGLRTLGIEMIGVGGQAGSTSRIENYLGFPLGIAGGELAQRAVVQAEKFGARLATSCEAVSLREENGYLVVRLSDGTDVSGRAVVVATGAAYRRLPVPNLAQFEGTGVYYAATDIEARQCAAAPVIVVGGGNSAGQAALFMADTASSVIVAIRGDDLGAGMSRYLVDRIERHPKIEVRTRTEVVGMAGDRTMTSVTLRGPGGTEERPCSALFSFIGAEPASQWLSSCAALDDHGFVLTDRSIQSSSLDERWEQLGRGPLPYETNRPGLFAVGDIRSGSTKRVATAVGEGSGCVSSIHQYLTFAPTR